MARLGIESQYTRSGRANSTLSKIYTARNFVQMVACTTLGDVNYKIEYLIELNSFCWQKLFYEA